MNLDLLRSLTSAWREDAALLERRGLEREARMVESFASELEQRLREWELQELTIPEASLESGYSEDHLRRLVRNEVLPDNRPPGSEGEIRIRRRDLPRRPNQTGAMMSVVDALAEELGR